MQKLRFSKYFKGIIILLDISIIALIFIYFFNIRKEELKIVDVDWEQNIFSIALLTLFWILLSGRTKLYDIPRNLTYMLYIERFVIHILVFLFGIILLGKVSNNIFIKYERFGLALSLFLVFLILKTLIFSVLKFLRLKGLNYRNVMFLGKHTDARDILENALVFRKDYGFKIHTYSDAEIAIDKLVRFWRDSAIHTLYMPVSDSSISNEIRSQIYQQAEINKIRIALIPELNSEQFFNYELSYIESQPILIPSKFPLEYFTNWTLKRTFDIVFSSFVLLFIGVWLFPLLALLIKISSKGPVIFRQKRYGYHDEIFYCYKFRTMIVNSDSSTKTTSENDDRITKIGRILRKTSLDEMPQFVNVLLGDMSVVGPRPHMLLVDDYYKPKIGRYAIRSLVKPGITGLAQVSGLRGDVGDMNLGMKKRILADAFYVKNWSIILDMVIVFKTMLLVLGGDKKAN